MKNILQNLSITLSVLIVSVEVVATGTSLPLQTSKTFDIILFAMPVLIQLMVFIPVYLYFKKRKKELLKRVVLIASVPILATALYMVGAWFWY